MGPLPVPADAAPGPFPYQDRPHGHFSGTEDIRASFKVLDKDGDGLLSRDDFVTALDLDRYLHDPWGSLLRFVAVGQLRL